MNRLHVIGGKNHGKTRLVVELVQELLRRGLRVGTVKHTHHDHELDVPGKDSFLHRQAGAQVVGILTRSMSAVFCPMTPPADRGEKGDRYAAMNPMFEACDIVLVEGDSETTAPKIEVWRSCLGTPPLALKDPAILAVVTDDAVEVGRPVLARSNVSALADWVATTFLK
jgi:molybdopterin-guanine dinucleotide biosynthesis protein B